MYVLDRNVDDLFGDQAFTFFARKNQEFKNGRVMNASQPFGRVHRAPFEEKFQNLACPLHRKMHCAERIRRFEREGSPACQATVTLGALAIFTESLKLELAARAFHGLITASARSCNTWGKIKVPTTAPPQSGPQARLRFGAFVFRPTLGCKTASHGLRLVAI